MPSVFLRLVGSSSSVFGRFKRPWSCSLIFGQRDAKARDKRFNGHGDWLCCRGFSAKLFRLGCLVDCSHILVRELLKPLLAIVELGLDLLHILQHGSILAFDLVQLPL